MKKGRKKKGFLLKGFIVLTVIVAMLLFVLSSLQMTLANPVGMTVMWLSGTYLVMFCSANM